MSPDRHTHLGLGRMRARILRSRGIFAANGIKGTYLPTGIGRAKIGVRRYEVAIGANCRRAVMPLCGRRRVLFLDYRYFALHARPGLYIQDAIIVGVQVIAISTGEILQPAYASHCRRSRS